MGKRFAHLVASTLEIAESLFERFTDYDSLDVSFRTTGRLLADNVSEAHA